MLDLCIYQNLLQMYHYSSFKNGIFRGPYCIGYHAKSFLSWFFFSSKQYFGTSDWISGRGSLLEIVGPGFSLEGMVLNIFHYVRNKK